VPFTEYALLSIVLEVNIELGGVTVGGGSSINFSAEEGKDQQVYMRTSQGWSLDRTEGVDNIPSFLESGPIVLPGQTSIGASALVLVATWRLSTKDGSG